MQCAWATFPSVTFTALQYFSTLSHKRHDFRKIPNYQISCKSFRWEPSSSMLVGGRTDRQTDMTKVIIAFRNFVNARKRTVFPKLYNHTKPSGVAFGLPPLALYFRRVCDLAFRSWQLLPYTDHCQRDLVSSSARRCCVQTVVAWIDLSCDSSTSAPCERIYIYENFFFFINQCYHPRRRNEFVIVIHLNQTW